MVDAVEQRRLQGRLRTDEDAIELIARRAGGALILVVLLVSMDLYGSEELSKIVPLYSLSYVLIALIGQFFLGERVTLPRWIGILTIVADVVVLLDS